LLVELKSVEDTSWLQLFIKNSRLGRFCAAQPSRHPQRVPPGRAPFLPKLQGQVAEFLSEGSPVHLQRILRAHQRRFAVRSCRSLARGFSWRYGCSVLRVSLAVDPPRTPQCMSRRFSLPTPPTHPHARCPIRGATLPLRVPPSLVTRPARCRNVDLLSIGYALRPRLRPDYPWVDHPGPGTLGLSVAGILTLLSRYSYRHSHSHTLHPRFHSSFSAVCDAPLPPAR